MKKQKHTHLYFTLGIFVVIAVIFFGLRQSSHFAQSPQGNSPDPSRETKDTLSPEEIAEKERLLADPALIRKDTLTPEEIAEKKRMLAN